MYLQKNAFVELPKAFYSDFPPYLHRFYCFYFQQMFDSCFIATDGAYHISCFFATDGAYLLKYSSKKAADVLILKIIQCSFKSLQVFWNFNKILRSYCAGKVEP